MENNLNQLETELETDSILEATTEDESVSVPSGNEKLQSALRKERQRARDLERRAKELEKKLNQFSGIDHDEYEKLKQEKEKAEKEKLVQDENWKALSARQKKELEQYQAEVKKANQQIEELNKKNQIARLFYIHGGIETTAALTGRSSVDLFYEAILPRLEFDEKGKITVLDLQGMEDRDADNNPKTVEQLIEELKSDPFYGNFFASTEIGGGGIKGSLNGSRNRRPRFEDWAKSRGLKTS